MLFNRIKRKLIPILALVACLAMFLGFNFTKQVSAQTADVESNVFAMNKVASVYVNPDAVNDARIRFGVQIGYDYFEQNKTLDNDANDETLTLKMTINKEGFEVNGARVFDLTISEADFANAVNEILTFTRGIEFTNVANRLAEATAIRLEAQCYYETVTDPVYAENSGVVQDMRSVVSYWLAEGNAFDEETQVPVAEKYIGGQAVVEENEITKLSAGTVSGVIDLASDAWNSFVDGKDVAGFKVYVNSNLIDGASIAGSVLTLPKESLDELLSINFVQVFDENNNVIVKEFVNEIPVVDGGYFSVKDGYTVEGAVEASILNNDAVKDGAFDTLSVENGVINGLTTIKGDALTNVTIRVATETETKDITVKAATKIIDDASDLRSVYKGSTTTTGYFFVANDIEFDKNVTISPTITGLSTGSNFSGVFDGNGHTIEYGVVKGGLFGNLLRATIKNVKLIVRSVPDSYSSYSHAIIAGYSKYSTLVNVYASYQLFNESGEVVDFNAGKTKQSTSKNKRYGLGLFSATQTDGTGYASIFTNVIVDMSKVVMDADQTNDDFGIFGAPTTNKNFGTFTNCYVVWTENLIANASYTWANGGYTNILAYAKNDEESYNTSSITCVSKHLLNGISRYDTLAKMVEAGNTTVGNFEVTATGVTWKNN